ncbi:DUF6351 family protein [Aurantiacibacter poecillastricola]|uniref:DUF6351 family protein n=1 Tax=Aurantiacibacter poecillastricola TaxID=3064385 RepID=UPI0027400A6F|nr:DUF6351 family protein [Aurantiacibacter sp. 219JJ12-13]MDP5260775.1 DUF6351 family protein [Aurantiacibacter sp. 219JJ12-13]
MRHHALAAASLIALAIGVPAAITAQSPDAAASEQALAERCESMAWSVAHRDDVEITSATTIPAGPTEANPFAPSIDLPAYCRVEGMINRRTGAGGKEYGIGFQLALPLDWNGRYLLQGGGGLNGAVRPATGPVAAGAEPALARGFAVASHDSGHQGQVFDDSFYADQRAALDFAETSVLTVTQVTRALAESFYETAPHHSYMTGCSTGGREGMLASQRYPELFDGIVIGAPAMQPGHSNLAIENAQVLLNATRPAGETGVASLTPAELAVVDSELSRQCDAQDGSADGIIANVHACRAFDASALQCAPGESEGCLAPERAEAVRLAMASPRESNGRPIYQPYPWDTGITFSGPGLPGFLPVGQGGPLGPPSDARTIDIDQRIHEVRQEPVGRLTDTAYWTNLSTYLDRGSKLMFFHGVSDPWFSAFDTWDYFQRAREANGAERWGDAARFYMVPGMMHCSGGNAFSQFDLLGPMVDWVENDKAPGAITASRPDSDAQMPLCPHPSYAHYTGGAEGAASSYECRMPQES